MAGVEVGTAYLSIVPSAKGFAGKLSSQIGGGAESAGRAAGDKAGKGLRSGLSGHMKAAAGLIAGAFAVEKVTSFFKEANAEARESQKVGALTTQVIKSTGGAAKVSATQVGNLATAISNKTGIDDEAIQSGANMLLTFKNIRNEAGKGNDIFNQSTSILTDMASVMGTEPKKAAIQLGKALNDPVKGISALSRVGVTFTDQQKKTITALVKGGKTAQAQKIILTELKSEFGGAAAAQATMGEKVSTAWANFKEAVGTDFLPAEDALLGGLDKIIIGATNLVSKAGKPINDFFTRIHDSMSIAAAGFKNSPFKASNLISDENTQKLYDIGGKIHGVFDSIAGVAKTVGGAIKNAFAGIDLGSILGAFSPLGSIIKGMWPALQGTVPLFVQLGKTLLGAFAQVLPIVAQGWLTIGKALGGALAKALPIIVPLIGKIAASLGDTLAKVLPIVAKLFGQLATIVGGVLAKVLPIVAAVFAQLASAVLPILAKLLPVLVKGIGQIALTLFPALGQILVAILPILEPIISILAQLAKAVLPIVIALLKVLVPVINVLVKVLAGIITVIAKVVTWFLNLSKSSDKTHAAVVKMWNGIKDAFSGALHWVSNTWTKGWSAVSGWVSGAVGKGRDLAKSALQGMQDKFSSLKSWAGSTWSRGWSAAKGWIANPVGSAKDLIGRHKSQIQDAFNGLDDFGRHIFGKKWAGIKDTFTKPIANVVDYLKRVFGPGGGGVRQIFTDFVSGAGRILAKLKSAITAPIKNLIGAINTGLIKGGINWILNKLGVPKNKQVPWIPVPKFATGGAVFGAGTATSDSIPAMLSNNEHVWTAAEVQGAGGHDRVEQLREAARKGALAFAKGGRVWPTNTHRLSPTYPGHSGVDIAAFQGAPIFATEPGRITYTGWNHGYGQAIFEQFTNGLQAVYGHTSKLLTRAGQVVKAGQEIGLVGATGHATGPHLHFEVNSPGPFGNAADRARSLAYLNGATVNASGGDISGAISDVLGFLKGLSPVQWLKNKASAVAQSLTGGGLWGAGLASIPGMIIDKAKATFANLFSRSTGTSPSGSNQQTAKAMLSQFGFGADQWGPLQNLWMKESGFRTNATNPDSGAYGIPQALPGSKMASAGSDWRNNPATQIRWGLGYIKSRYGNPAAAWAHSQRLNWYAGGTNGAAPGWAMVGERGPELVNFRGGEQVRSNSESMAAGQHYEFNDCQFGANPQEVVVSLRRESRRRMNAVNLTAAA